MLALNTAQNSPLPYQPLPVNAYNAARDSIISYGFSPNAILNEYSFSTPGYLVKINALAFAHPTRTLAEDAGFTLYNAISNEDDEAIVRILAQSAAPFHLIHRHDRFSFWATGFSNNQVQPIPIQSNIAYTELASALSEYAVDLKPQRIIDVKQGRDQFTHPVFVSHEIHPRQLSLWAADVTRPLLVKYFGDAVNELREYLTTDENTVVKIATQLLGVVILADTGGLGNEARQIEGFIELEQLLKIAHDSFPNYFDQQLFSNYHKPAQRAYSTLRQIRYAGFVPDMLTDLYKAAYDKEHRKELGRYDTPLYLTRRIWETIPIEFLPPNQRVIADMTCGWGSFLIAGYERLSRLKDIQNLSLRDYLYGNDVNTFTAQLAGLGLLISTSEDKWHIDAENALRWYWLNENQPNIIVGNPPFGGARKGDQKKSSSDKKERYEEANKFLERAIERLAPNGYLAMLMPQSFIEAEASPYLRKQLLESCDMLELWELPIGVFPEATAGTVVLFAQKKDNSHKTRQTSVRVRTVQRQTLINFEKSGIFTASGIVDDQSTWDAKSRKSKASKNTHIINYKLTLPEFVWKKITSNCVEISQRVIIFPGAIVGERPERKRWKNYLFPKQVPWLTNAKNVIMRPFFIDYNQATVIKYPNDLEEPRKNKNYPEKDKERLLANTKVLLTATHNPSWGARVKIAIERRGHYVSDSFWVIVPTPESELLHITHEVVAAVVGWKVSNAWIVEHLKYPKIPARAIRTIPFPRNLSEKDCHALTEAVNKLEAAAFANHPEPTEANQVIDTILKAAYQLDDQTFDRLRLVYDWDDNPQITLDPSHPADEATWIISGVVDHLDVTQGTITLWLDSFDELQTVPIHPAMPGWMLRSEAAFRTKIPRDCVRQESLKAVRWGRFLPQEYTYMSEEELFEDLTNIFYPNASYIHDQSLDC